MQTRRKSIRRTSFSLLGFSLFNTINAAPIHTETGFNANWTPIHITGKVLAGDVKLVLNND
jgi:hypothetical protein